MPNELLLVGITAAAGLLAYRLYKDKRRSDPSLPPGPNRYPLIGNLLSVPTEHEYLGFMKLGEQLESKIFSLNVFGTTIIVLNDKDDVINLFEKRSAIYSDRTCPTMVEDSSLLDWGDLVTITGYGDQWRRLRRLMNPWLTKQAVVAYDNSQEQATRKLLQRLLNSNMDITTSHQLETEILSSVSATLFRSMYGYEVRPPNDPLVTRTQKLVSYFSFVMASSNCLVNTIPALRYLPEWCPGTGWKREASKWRKEKERLVSEMYNIGLENMKKDESTQIMVAAFRREALKLGRTEEGADKDVKSISIALLGAGIETTVSTLMMFITAMILYPEVQKKAQAELDAVIGDTRLPNVEDRSQLGYIERIIQEILRWRPAVPLAIPHTCFQDDIYKGYFIPKGAVVIGNAWAITRDETVYKNPDAFDPDRFLDPSTPPAPTFGWGRRRCPGIHFGESALFIAIASILMTFNIGVGQDKSGKDVPPSGKLVNALVLLPEEFMLKLTPRSAKHEELIRSYL